MGAAITACLGCGKLHPVCRSPQHSHSVDVGTHSWYYRTWGPGWLLEGLCDFRYMNTNLEGNFCPICFSNLTKLSPSYKKEGQRGIMNPIATGLRFKPRPAWKPGLFNSQPDCLTASLPTLSSRTPLPQSVPCVLCLKDTVTSLLPHSSVTIGLRAEHGPACQVPWGSPARPAQAGPA